jgi:outer membrane protein assembly factor BamA
VIGYARVQPTAWFTVRGSFGWLRQPDIDSPAGPFRGGYTDAHVLFSNDSAPGLFTPASFIHGAVSAIVDTRNAPGHPTRGGLYRAGWAGYDDRDTGQYSFQRYEAEGEQFIPLVSSRWVFAVHGWLVASDTADGKMVPVYMIPSLGGADTLRGYADYRFHDRNLLLLSGESRWALMEHVDAALFLDAGNVAPRVGDLNLDKTSYGVGLRVHTHLSTLVRLDVGHSSDGWRVFFKMDDPFGLSSRLSRRTATVPFVP